jgi:hypothetical protein
MLLSFPITTLSQTNEIKETKAFADRRENQEKIGKKQRMRSENMGIKKRKKRENKHPLGIK